MKKTIKTTAQNVERIEIDFYNYDIIEEENIQATSKKQTKRILSNTSRVIKDVTTYIQNKGYVVLNSHQSNNVDSNSTYYDVDIQVKSNHGDVKYIYFRISDHDENPTNEIPRNNYHQRLTRQYEGISDDSQDVSHLYAYHSIKVSGKRYNNYDRALNRIKERINEVLD